MQETEETWVPPLGQEDPLEEGAAPLSSTLAWRIPRTEEPGGLQSMGSHRVGRHDRLALAQLTNCVCCWLCTSLTGCLGFASLVSHTQEAWSWREGSRLWKLPGAQEACPFRKCTFFVSVWVAVVCWFNFLS